MQVHPLAIIGPYIIFFFTVNHTFVSKGINSRKIRRNICNIYIEYINKKYVSFSAYGVNYRIHNIYTVCIFHQCNLEHNIYIFTPYCPHAHEYLHVILLLLSLMLNAFSYSMQNIYINNCITFISGKLLQFFATVNTCEMLVKTVHQDASKHHSFLLNA